MKPLLITDGECSFCQLSAAWLARHFPGEWINQPSQKSDLSQLGLTKAQVDKQVWYLTFSGGTWSKSGGAKAIAKLLINQPKKYIKPIAYLMLVPGISAIAQFAYLLVAKNRSKLMWVFRSS